MNNCHHDLPSHNGATRGNEEFGFNDLLMSEEDIAALQNEIAQHETIEDANFIQIEESQNLRREEETPDVATLQHAWANSQNHHRPSNDPDISGALTGRITDNSVHLGSLSDDFDESGVLDDDSDLEIDHASESAQVELQQKRSRGKATAEDELNFTRLRQRYRNVHHRVEQQRLDQQREELGQCTDDSETDDDDDEIFVQERHKKKPSGTAAGQKRHKKTMSTTPAKKTKQPSQIARAQQVEAREQNNLANFSSGAFSTNVYHNVISNQAREEQPTFTATRRGKALSEMVASIPLKSRAIAKIDRKQMEKSLKYFNGACRPNGAGAWKLYGLQSFLTSYQMLGVSFMRKRELEGAQQGSAAGGLIADAMGLGKTVMCIANIVNGKPHHGTKFEGDACRTTLVVVPSSLVSQWMSEIKKHAVQAQRSRQPGIRRFAKHCAKSRIGDIDDPEQTKELMKKQDIIVTTYNEVCRQYPKYAPPTSCQTALQKEEWWAQTCEEQFGPLHRLIFHRVILDEATAIKNYRSRTSIACRGLMSKYRWAVTGTPAQNRNDEFYPYFKFLEIPNTGSYRTFCHNYITNPDGRGQDRLHLMLRSFMLKRDHADELMGSKLLSLPKTKQDTTRLFLTQVERQIYTIVHRRFVSRINGIARAGKLKNNYRHIFVLLTRLRQLISHPLLIHDTMRDLLEPEDFVALQTILTVPRGEHHEQESLLSHLRVMMRKPDDLPVLEPDAITEGNSVEMDFFDIDLLLPDENTGPLDYNGGAFARKDSTQAFLQYIAQSQPRTIAPNAECTLCRSVNTDLVMMLCGHDYCHDCVLKMNTDTLQKEPTKPRQSTCIECGRVFQPTKRQLLNDNVAEEEDKQDQEEDESTQVGRKRKRKANVKDHIDTWIDAQGHMVPSSKTTAVKAQILEWKQQDPSAKIIIYTQFLTMSVCNVCGALEEADASRVRILEKMCAMEGWKCRQLHGSVSLDRRDKNISEFGSQNDVTILISTIKSGGLGLNLTMASRVILMDLWWNTAVEEQAFCRMYRRGQEKETAMMRMSAANTIDDKILRMQERKEEEIDNVMKGQKCQNLTPRELMSLFGLVKTDDKGIDFIVISDEPGGTAKRPHEQDRDEDISGNEL